MVSGDKVDQNGTKTEIKGFKNCALSVIYVYINLGFYNVYTMDRLVILFVTLALLLNNISYPSEAKGGKNKPSTIRTSNVKPIPTQLPKPSSEKPSSIPNDIFQAIEAGKKYLGSQSTEKSQLETQSEYEARIAKTQSLMRQTIELSIPAESSYLYDAENQFLVVSMGSDIVSPPYVSGVKPLRSSKIELSKEQSNITCSNGYEVRFNFLHTKYIKEFYSIGIFEKKAFENENDPSWSDTLTYRTINNDGISFYGKYKDFKYGSFFFKIPMNVEEARRYISTDEKYLNKNLSFKVTLNPAFPFYKKYFFFIGNECGGKYSNDGTSLTLLGYEHFALFNMVNLKLIDLSSGRIFIDRNYTHQQ